MAHRATPRTDFGTVLLHGVLVALLAVSVVTGLRIATVSPLNLAWLQAIDGVLPDTIVWTAHMPAAVLLFGVVLAYIVYIRRAGLARRIRPDRARLMGLFRGGQGRWSAINIIFTWILLLTLLLQLVTGCMIYLGHGGMTVELHRFGTWMLIAGVAVHVATHLALGGVRQLMRIFRPGRLPPPAAPLRPIRPDCGHAAIGGAAAARTGGAAPRRGGPAPISARGHAQVAPICRGGRGRLCRDDSGYRRRPNRHAGHALCCKNPGIGGADARRRSCRPSLAVGASNNGVDQPGCELRRNWLIRG